MNSRAQPPRTAGVRGASLLLLLGLLPCMVGAGLAPPPDHRRPIRSRPYLAVLGSSSLRIQEASLPSDPNTHPPSGAPPQPATAGPPTTHAPPAEASTPAEAPSSVVTPPASESPTAPTPEEKPTKPVRSILPDDTRPKVKAEDFLPFFQPPGADHNPNDVTVAPTAPAPGVQPPSSATYRQQ